MIDLLQSARAKGEAAIKRAVWAFAGAGLLVLAMGFAAAGLVEAFKLIAPAWAAFSLGAFFLLLAAWFCGSRSHAPNPSSSAEGALNLHNEEGVAPLGSDASDWRHILNEALIRESQDKPARAAAIAAIAGLVLGAIEGLDESRRA